METGTRTGSNSRLDSERRSLARPLAGTPFQTKAREGDPPRLRVACVEPIADWLQRVWGELELAGIALELFSTDEALHPSKAREPIPRVLHLSVDALPQLRRFRKNASESRLVLDLTAAGDAGLGRRLAFADLLLVGSLVELRELRRRRPRLMRTSVLMRPPVDLDRYAPEHVLARSQDAELARLRLQHRLVEPIVLYHGAVDAASGVDLAIEALGEASHEAKLVLLLEDEVDARFLERCRVRAAALHVTLDVVSPSDDELPLWYALATIVCAPSRETLSAGPAMLAAAAACPFVGGEAPILLEHVREGETGYIVRTDDVQELARVLETLLVDEQERRRLGDAGRQLAESQLSSAAAAERVASLWRRAADMSANSSLGQSQELDSGSHRGGQSRGAM